MTLQIIRRPHNESFGITCRQYLDYVIASHDLGLLTSTGVETTVGCMTWFIVISHPYIIILLEDMRISRPPGHVTLDEIVVEERIDHQ